MAIDRSDQARLTISRLKLNRPELLLKRKDKLYEVLRIMELMIACGRNQAVKNALKEDLREKLLVAAEYANCVHCFVNVEAPQRGVELT